MHLNYKNIFFEWTFFIVISCHLVSYYTEKCIKKLCKISWIIFAANDTCEICTYKFYGTFLAKCCVLILRNIFFVLTSVVFSKEIATFSEKNYFAFLKISEFSFRNFFYKNSRFFNSFCVAIFDFISENFDYKFIILGIFRGFVR